MKNLIWILLMGFVSCSEITEDSSSEKSKKEIDHSSFVIDAQALVEIPAGTLDKFELNKKTNEIEHEHKKGIPRVVQYLAYPANYGLIPNTLLDKKDGGDGDPLDVLILGEAVSRECLLDIKIIGALKLMDRGEQDDKLIAVSPGTPFSDLNTLTELDAEFAGVSTIIETWFTNYKGPGKMESLGFMDRDEALQILDLAEISNK